NRFFHQSFPQTNSKVPGQNFHDVLTFARGQIREARLQQLRFRNRSPRAMEFFEKLVRFRNGEWLRLRSSVQNLERGFAQIAVTGRDAMKFWIADFCRREQRAINHYPTNL